eukprot:TRINITY_DN7464_c0_g1_i1.p3 TRINITY_DN7464_c0_g1~~TRINITY_DN7464_c0_g1_i1.p3  ORF type:complete len:101 (+),score=39.37 TRINITY_DN7464_c0_g1_i1:87-389(+)
MLFFFFFKQKTAYEIMPSLVGSEMCIRDRVSTQSTWDSQAEIDDCRNRQLSKLPQKEDIRIHKKLIQKQQIVKKKISIVRKNLKDKAKEKQKKKLSLIHI